MSPRRGRRSTKGVQGENVHVDVQSVSRVLVQRQIRFKCFLLRFSSFFLSISQFLGLKMAKQVWTSEPEKELIRPEQDEAWSAGGDHEETLIG